MSVRVTPVGPLLQSNNESAEGDRERDLIVSTGLVGTFAGPDLNVAQHAGTPGLSVDIAAGRALILGTSTSFQGMYHFSNDAVVQKAISTPDNTNPRIDIVCASIQDAAYAGGTNIGVLQVVTGTAGSSPAVPATPASSIVLAHVYVTANAVSILNANINGTTGTNNPDVYPFTQQRCVPFQAYSAGGSSGTITGGSPGTAVAATSVYVNPVSAARNIRVTIDGYATFSGAATGSVAIFRDASVNLAQSNFSGSTNVQDFSALTVDTPTAGVHVYQARAWLVGAGNIVVNICNICVDDLGPA